MAGAVPSLSFQKVGNWGGGAFLSWYKSRQSLLGARKIFPEFPQTSPKSFFVKLLPTKFLLQRSFKTFFWCGLQKSSSCVFLQTLGAIY